MVRPLTGFNMQITIPGKIYGGCEYLEPEEIAVWLSNHNLHGVYVGSTYGGWGGDIEYFYIAHGATEEDAIAFKLSFPDCKVHCSALK